ncbi:hypothetical protein ACFSUK_22720 [Sphingobium scionense]
MPRLAPVTIATLPSSGFMILSLSRLRARRSARYDRRSRDR